MPEPEVQFTPTEVRILALLSDGQPHAKTELLKCIDDELTDLTALRMHFTRIRRKIRPLGQDVICEFVKRQTMYRHVRLLGSSHNGYR
jgi:DNA-binding response OmpR family regulator